MTYKQAKKLHIGDIIETKFFVLGRTIRITEIQIEEKDVFVRDENGRLYHHTALVNFK